MTREEFQRLCRERIDFVTSGYNDAAAESLF